MNPRAAPLRRSHPPRIVLPLALALGASLALLLSGPARAQVGAPVESVVADFASLSDRPALLFETGVVVGDALAVSAEARGGRLFELSGEGLMNEANVAGVGDLVAFGTGVPDIDQPVEEFLQQRLGELTGQGLVAVGVVGHVLELDVSGETAPYRLRWALRLQSFDEALFPEPAGSLGPADAAFVVREFSDFQCPFCARYAGEVLPGIKAELLARGDVRFEYHHFPLTSIHPNAAPAAVAAECVADLAGSEAFWSYHDALFAQQDRWAGLADPSGFFVELASELELGDADLATCLAEDRFAPEVQQAFDLAAGVLRLSGTPTVFVNGYRLQAFNDLDAYLELIGIVDAFSDEDARVD